MSIPVIFSISFHFTSIRAFSFCIRVALTLHHDSTTANDLNQSVNRALIPNINVSIIIKEIHIKLITTV